MKCHIRGKTFQINQSIVVLDIISSSCQKSCAGLSTVCFKHIAFNLCHEMTLCLEPFKRSKQADVMIRGNCQVCETQEET